MDPQTNKGKAVLLTAILLIMGGLNYVGYVYAHDLSFFVVLDCIVAVLLIMGIFEFLGMGDPYVKKMEDWRKNDPDSFYAHVHAKRCKCRK